MLLQCSYAIMPCNVLLQFNFTEVKLLEQNKKTLPVHQTSHCMCINYRLIVLYIFSLNGIKSADYLTHYWQLLSLQCINVNQCTPNVPALITTQLWSWYCMFSPRTSAMQFHQTSSRGSQRTDLENEAFFSLTTCDEHTREEWHCCSIWNLTNIWTL